MEYYVYQLIDPRTNDIFYIGKGQEKRMYQHVDAVKRNKIPNGSNTKLGNKIKKILILGLKIKYKKVFITEIEQEAYDKEKQLIKEIGLENLCNLTYGGEGGGMLGKTISEKQKKQISNVHKGKILSDETKKKISDAQQGDKNHFYNKKHSKETKNKISNSKKGQIPWNKGISRSEEIKRKISETLKLKIKRDSDGKTE